MTREDFQRKTYIGLLERTVVAGEIDVKIADALDELLVPALGDVHARRHRLRGTVRIPIDPERKAIG